MANYITSIRTPWSAEKAFEYLADFRNAEEWDPGVSSSRMTSGDKPGKGAVYAVTANGAKLDYTQKEFKVNSRTVLEGDSKFFYSYDILAFEPDGDGCFVTYDATLKTLSVAAIVNPVLFLLFDRIGNSARDSLLKKLDGVEVAERSVK